jgi:transcriptional regulator with XRE-family HTH domain
MRKAERARRIRYYARRARLSRGDIARLLDITEQAVWQWTTGRATPTIDNLARFCTICGIDLHIFFAPRLLDGLNDGNGDDKAA